MPSPPRPAEPTGAALLVIDVQRGFDDPRWGARNNADAERNIAALLRGWRASRWPVVHVRHDSEEPGSPLRAGEPGNEPKAEARPAPGEPVHAKRVNSAFIGTELEAELRRAGVGALVIVGLTTNHCVSTTARMAANLDFDVRVVRDATAAFERRALDGRMRPAEEVHDAALSDLDGEFARVVSTREVLPAP